MFYQPERKMTLVVMTNYHGLDIYAVARKLYEELPELVCGNDKSKQNYIQICYNGNSMCIPRHTVQRFIEKGAVLGSCENAKQGNSLSTSAVIDQNKTSVLTLFPNPSRSIVNIGYTSRDAGPVAVQLFDAKGSLVSTLFNGKTALAETRSWRINVSTLTPGIYFIRSQSRSGIAQQKLVVSAVH